MEDFFKLAGIDPTRGDDDHARGDEELRPAEPRGGEKRRFQEEHEPADPFGGHNLRRVIRARDGEGEKVVVQRPKSTFASSIHPQFLESVAEREPDRASQVQRAANTGGLSDEDASDESAEDDYDDSEDDEETTSTQRTSNVTVAPVVQGAPTPVLSQKPPAVPNPIPLTKIKADSQLGKAAADLFTTEGFNLQRELGWQAAVAGDTTKMKALVQENGDRYEGQWQQDLKHGFGKLTLQTGDVYTGHFV